MRIMEGAWNQGEENSSLDDHGTVTVAWQNISAHLTLVDLVSFLELLGFENAYEDVFVVVDGSGASTGVAMVTFNTMTEAWAFQSLVDGKVGKVFGNASEPCKVVIDGVKVASKHWLNASKAEDVDTQDLIRDSFLKMVRGDSSPQQKPWLPGTLVQGPSHAKPGAAARNKISSQPLKAPAEVSANKGASLEEPERAWPQCLGPPPGLHERLPEELPEWPAGVKTAMVRNIACRFKEQDVIKELDSLGLHGSYDGVRVPRKPMMQSNLGYAFVNFCSPEAAKLCRLMCNGRAFGASYTTKVCEVVPAHIQGTITDVPKAKKRGATKRAPPNPAYSAAMQPYAATMPPYAAAMQPYAAALQPYTAAMPPYAATLQPYTAAMQPYAAAMQIYAEATQPCAAHAVHADPKNLSWISV